MNVDDSRKETKAKYIIIVFSNFLYVPDFTLFNTLYGFFKIWTPFPKCKWIRMLTN